MTVGTLPVARACSAPRLRTGVPGNYWGRSSFRHPLWRNMDLSRFLLVGPPDLRVSTVPLMTVGTFPPGNRFFFFFFLRQDGLGHQFFAYEQRLALVFGE